MDTGNGMNSVYGVFNGVDSVAHPGDSYVSSNDFNGDNGMDYAKKLKLNNDPTSLSANGPSYAQTGKQGKVQVDTIFAYENTYCVSRLLMLFFYYYTCRHLAVKILGQVQHLRPSLKLKVNAFCCLKPTALI